jgi:ribonuclease-3
MPLVDVVEAVTGHRFRDEALLQEAFTHASWAHEHPGHPHYERLEFLGDAVVGLCVTRLLCARFPTAAEGTLTNLRQRTVSARALGPIAEDLKLEPHLRKGAGFRSEEALRSKVASDVFEALVGALFEDAGLDACQAFVERCVGPRLAGLEPLVDEAATGAAKNRLQEFTQARFGVTPEYVVRSAGRAHELTFHATVRVAGDPVAEGTGRRKKDAEADAAHLALVILERRDAEARAT